MCIRDRLCPGFFRPLSPVLIPLPASTVLSAPIQPAFRRAVWGRVAVSGFLRRSWALLNSRPHRVPSRHSPDVQAGD
eukprot:14059269-Alexandrium_andersonii.AAC.1